VLPTPPHSVVIVIIIIRFSKYKYSHFAKQWLIGYIYDFVHVGQLRFTADILHIRSGI
jgi:hypothetical protein